MHNFQQSKWFWYSWASFCIFLITGEVETLVYVLVSWTFSLAKCSSSSFLNLKNFFSYILMSCLYPLHIDSFVYKKFPQLVIFLLALSKIFFQSRRFNFPLTKLVTYFLSRFLACDVNIHHICLYCFHRFFCFILLFWNRKKRYFWVWN